MVLNHTTPFPLGKRTTLFYIDKDYKVQSLEITREMVENGNIKLPPLPYIDADYELYTKAGKVFTDFLNSPLVIYTEKETGKVSEPFVCKFVSYGLRDILINLGIILRDKVKRDYKERYPFVRFVVAITFEVLMECEYENYYKNHFGLLELDRLTEVGYSSILIQCYDKTIGEWTSFERRRLKYAKDLEDTKAQVQVEAQRLKEEIKDGRELRNEI